MDIWDEVVEFCIKREAGRPPSQGILLLAIESDHELKLGELNKTLISLKL